MSDTFTDREAIVREHREVNERGSRRRSARALGSGEIENVSVNSSTVPSSQIPSEPTLTSEAKNFIGCDKEDVAPDSAKPEIAGDILHELHAKAQDVPMQDDLRSRQVLNMEDDEDSDLSVLADEDFVSMSFEEPNVTGLSDTSQYNSVDSGTRMPGSSSRGLNSAAKITIPEFPPLETRESILEVLSPIKASIVGGRSLRLRLSATYAPSESGNDGRMKKSSHLLSILSPTRQSPKTADDMAQNPQGSTNFASEALSEVSPDRMLLNARASKMSKEVSKQSEDSTLSSDNIVRSEAMFQAIRAQSHPISPITNDPVPQIIGRILSTPGGSSIVAISGLTSERRAQLCLPPKSYVPPALHARPVRNNGQPKLLMNEATTQRDLSEKHVHHTKRKAMDSGLALDSEPIYKKQNKRLLRKSIDQQQTALEDETKNHLLTPSAIAASSAETSDRILPQTEAQIEALGVDEQDFVPENHRVEAVFPQQSSSGSTPRSFRKRTATKYKLATKKNAMAKLLLGDGSAQVETQENLTASKPLPCGAPPVWANKRQALCEALPYFRAYQSGAYAANGIVVAQFMDKSMDLRDFVSNEVVVTNLGGGRTQDPKTKKMEYASDNLMEGDSKGKNLLRGFETALRFDTPVALIIGSGNTLAPSLLPHRFNVMDWFHVTDLYVEKTANDHKVWKVRLEKIDLASKSWWAPEGSANPEPVNYNISGAFPQTCTTCHHECETRYIEGWTCLNHHCSQFFMFENDTVPGAATYNEYWKNKRSVYTGPVPGALVPPLPTAESYNWKGQTGYESDCVKGIVCPQCHCCSRRIQWKGWECEQGCGYKLTIPLPILTVFDALSEEQNKSCVQFHESIVEYSQTITGPYLVHEYIVPGLTPGSVAGTVKHFKANSLINKQDHGPDEMFRDLQTANLGLKRKAARLAGNPDEILTAHFAKNFGAPYKYGVAVESMGFKDAPDAILRAVARLSWAGRQTVSGHFEPFNELLALGYRETDHIGYHDDGEDTLGPTVSSISLGCSAAMNFRVKQNKRKDFQPSVGKVNGKTKSGIVLHLNLEHGDMVVMHGHDIQRIYEHSVQPNGKVRFALTGRHILPEKMAAEVDRAIAAADGMMPERLKAFVYDGDVNTIEGNTRIDLEAALETFKARLRTVINAGTAGGVISAEDVSGLLQDMARETACNTTLSGQRSHQDISSSVSNTQIGTSTNDTSLSTEPIAPNMLINTQQH